MCNFIIRKDVKSYATIDVVEEQRDGEVITIEQGDWLEVQYIKDKSVHALKMGVVDVVVPLEVFVHAFSDKNPNEKKEDKKS